MLESYTDVQVYFDGSKNVYVFAPAPYQSAMCGLCGNFDGIADNDLFVPRTGAGATPNAFANANVSVRSVPMAV